MPLNLYVLVPIMIIFKIMCYFHLANPIRQLIISLHSKLFKCNVRNNLPTSVIDYNFNITWRLNGRVSYIQCVSQIAVTNVILLTNKKLDDACIYVNQFHLSWSLNFVFVFLLLWNTTSHDLTNIVIYLWQTDRQTDRLIDI